MINTRTKTTTTTMTVADSAHTRDADVCALTPQDDSAQLDYDIAPQDDDGDASLDDDGDASLDHDNDDAGLLDDAASLDPFSGPAPFSPSRSSLYSPFSYSSSAFFDFEGEAFLDFEGDSRLGSEGDSFSMRSPICRDGRFGCAGSAGNTGEPGLPSDGAALTFGGDGPGLYQLFGFGLRAPAPITPFLAGEPDTEEAGELDTEEAGGCWQDHDHDTGRAGEEDAQHLGGAEDAQHLDGVECSETAWEDMSAFICDDALPVLVDRSPLHLIARDAGGEAALDAAWDRIRRYESSDDSDLDSSLGDDDGYSSLDDSYSDDLLEDDSQDESGLGSSPGDDSGSFALGSLPDTDGLSCAFDLWRLGLDSDRSSGMRLEEVAHVLAEAPTAPYADESSSPSETSITFGSLPDTDGFSCTSGLWRLALGGDGGE